jgi:hypothetical protein
MITTTIEYEKAQAELRDLTDRLARLQQTNAAGVQGFHQSRRAQDDRPFARRVGRL